MKQRYNTLDLITLGLYETANICDNKNFPDSLFTMLKANPAQYIHISRQVELLIDSVVIYRM